jgi:ATP-dependent Clp protease adaptor protein ClpS
VFVPAQYGGGDLPFRCGNAELSPASGDGFLTKLAMDRAWTMLASRRERRGPGSRGGAEGMVRAGLALGALAYYLTLHEGAALRHSRVKTQIRVTGSASRLSIYDVMAQFFRRTLPGAAQEIDGARPRLAGDDGKRRTDQGAPGGPGTAVITKTKPQTKRPNLYRVLLLNDDYTPMEFVVHVLERFFNKDREAATRIMLHVHHHGIGECGVFTYEIAETKVTQVMDFARKHQHPLQSVMEKK